MTVNARRSPALGGASRVILQPVVLVLELGGCTHDAVTAETTMPLPRLRRRQVERESRLAVLHEPEVDGGLASDLVGLVAQGQAERVVDRVDARLPRIMIGVALSARARGVLTDGRQK